MKIYTSEDERLEGISLQMILLKKKKSNQDNELFIGPETINFFFSFNYRKSQQRPSIN